MPTYGEKQKPAGVELNPAKPILGKRSMISKDATIATVLTIDQIPYKGNAALNANK
jgi:hypothetical protein